MAALFVETMRLIANCQLTGDYGVVSKDQSFILPDGDAQKLLDSGCARRADPPRVLYQSKPYRFETPTVEMEAPGVSARPPFRNMPVSHQESPPVVTTSDSLLPKADISLSGTADPGGRGKRKGPDPSR